MELNLIEEELAKGNEKKMGCSYRALRIRVGVSAIVIFLAATFTFMAGKYYLHMDARAVVGLIGFFLMFFSALWAYDKLKQEERYVRLTRKLLAEIERLEQNQKA